MAASRDGKLPAYASRPAPRDGSGCGSRSRHESTRAHGAARPDRRSRARSALPAATHSASARRSAGPSSRGRLRRSAPCLLVDADPAGLTGLSGRCDRAPARAPRHHPPLLRAAHRRPSPRGRGRPPDAPPIVALHGFPQHWYEWRRVIDRAARDFRILAMDTARARLVGARAPDGDYRKATIADDAIALLDELRSSEPACSATTGAAGRAGTRCSTTPSASAGTSRAASCTRGCDRGRCCAKLPRFLYQPPIAAPILGPRIIPPLVTRFIRGGWGDRETYDREAERDLRRALPRQGRRREPVLPAVPGPRGAARPVRAPDDPHAPPAGPQGPDRDRGSRSASSATATTRRRSCSTAAGTSCPEERPAEVARAVASLPWS